MSLPPGAMEQTEALEQLRLIENGRKVHAYETPEPIPRGVDTPEDLEAARQTIRSLVPFVVSIEATCVFRRRDELFRHSGRDSQ